MQWRPCRNVTSRNLHQSKCLQQPATRSPLRGWPFATRVPRASSRNAGTSPGAISVRPWRGFGEVGAFEGTSRTVERCRSATRWQFVSKGAAEGTQQRRGVPHRSRRGSRAPAESMLAVHQTRPPLAGLWRSRRVRRHKSERRVPSRCRSATQWRRVSSPGRGPSRASPGTNVPIGKARRGDRALEIEPLYRCSTGSIPPRP